MPSSHAKRIAVFLSLSFLTGCKPVGPNYNRPGYEAPPAYKEAGATSNT